MYTFSLLLLLSFDLHVKKKDETVDDDCPNLQLNYHAVIEKKFYERIDGAAGRHYVYHVDLSLFATVRCVSETNILFLLFH